MVNNKIEKQNMFSANSANASTEESVVAEKYTVVEALSEHLRKWYPKTEAKDIIEAEDVA